MIWFILLTASFFLLGYFCYTLGRKEGQKLGYLEGLKDAIDIANEILDEQDRKYPIHIPVQ